MKKLELKEMEVVDGGSCADEMAGIAAACLVVGFFSLGIGWIVGAAVAAGGAAGCMMYDEQHVIST